MASITDYLAKQLFIEKNVVTYRSLSRQFNIHVNSAKNELTTYHANPQSSSEQCYATYMISGELMPRPSPPSSQAMALSTQEDDGMDIDQPTQSQSSSNDNESIDPDSESVPRVKMTLVGEMDLEHANTKYARIYSQHIYCLSPSPLVDAGLICGPSTNVYAADAKLSPEQSILLGRVVGADVRIGKVHIAKGKPSLATSSKKPGIAPSASSSKIKEEPKDKVKKEEKETKLSKTEDAKKASPATSKPRVTGKLDWSKAKTKDTKKVEKEKPTEAKPPAVKEEESQPKLKIGPPSRARKMKVGASDASLSKKPSKPASSSSAASASEPPKRGVKRKSALPVDSDSDSLVASSGPSRPVSPPPTKSKGKAGISDVKIKKKVIISDDEDEDVQPKTRAQPKPIDKSLRAMMDMDDELVIKHSRRATSPPPSSDGEDTEQLDEDAKMVEDEEVKPVPKKRKPKKVIPVGSNGLKKRRVVKSRMTTDAKGYMVTEDYSEYESVDEDEPEEPKSKAKKPAAKGKKVETSESKPTKVVAKSKSATNLKGKKGSGGLMDFFGKK